MIKTAATEIPLSDEESLEASKALGRSLFSLIQLSKEREKARKAQMMQAFGPSEDDNVLRIPVPKDLLTPKQAAEDDDSEGIWGFGEPAYSYPDEYKPLRTETPGIIPHVKRNLGKYLGLGAGLATAAYNVPRLAKALKKIITNRYVLAGGGGLLLGNALMDQVGKEDHDEKIRAIRARKEELLRDMMYNQQMNQKEAAFGDAEDADLLGRLIHKQNKPMRMLMGGQQGFDAAQQEYYMQEKMRLKQELEKAQKEYINTLSAIRSKTAEETPNVDAFCNGMAYAALVTEESEKTAEDVDIEEGSLRRLLSDAFNTAKKPFMPAVDAAAGGLLNTGAGAAYLTYLMRKKMREPEMTYDENVPTRVELTPY